MGVGECKEEAGPTVILSSFPVSPANHICCPGTRIVGGGRLAGGGGGIWSSYFQGTRGLLLIFVLCCTSEASGSSLETFDGRWNQGPWGGSKEDGSNGTIYTTCCPT